MTRFSFGIFILVFFLVLGLWVAHTLDTIHLDISQELHRASNVALSGDLDTATTIALNAKEKWETSWQGTATVADHEPMDEIDGLLSQLSCFAQTENVSDFAACCTRCALLVEAISEAHSFTWWNLL